MSRSKAKSDTIMLTHGEGYSTLDGKAVSAKKALTFQQDLFVTPAEDGLFPGHSQTWRNEG